MSASEVAGTLEVDVGGGRAALGWRLRSEEEMRARRRDCLVPFCDQPWPVKRPRFADLDLGLGARDCRRWIAVIGGLKVDAFGVRDGVGVIVGANGRCSRGSGLDRCGRGDGRGCGAGVGRGSGGRSGRGGNSGCFGSGLDVAEEAWRDGSVGQLLVGEDLVELVFCGDRGIDATGGFGESFLWGWRAVECLEGRAFECADVGGSVSRSRGGARGGAGWRWVPACGIVRMATGCCRSAGGRAGWWWVPACRIVRLATGCRRSARGRDVVGATVRGTRGFGGRGSRWALRGRAR